MFGFPRSASAAVTLALLMAGCSSGGGPAALPPGGGLVPSAATRHQSSIHTDAACTPDSYGYCLVQTSAHYSDPGCADYGGAPRWINRFTWTLYYQGAADGNYSELVNDCAGFDTWSPTSPSAATGDPNLPSDD